MFVLCLQPINGAAAYLGQDTLGKEIFILNELKLQVK